MSYLYRGVSIWIFFSLAAMVTSKSSWSSKWTGRSGGTVAGTVENDRNGIPVRKQVVPIFPRPTTPKPRWLLIRRRDLFRSGLLLEPSPLDNHDNTNQTYVVSLLDVSHGRSVADAAGQGVQGCLPRSPLGPVYKWLRTLFIHWWAFWQKTLSKLMTSGWLSRYTKDV